MTGTLSFTRAVSWAFVMNLGSRGLSAIFLFLLAALVGPSAFGVVAISIAWVAIVEAILEQGLTTALIQRPKLDREHLDSVFGLVVAVGLVLTALTIALAPWWAHVNREPAVGPVIIALSPLVLIQSLTVVQIAWLQREMDFRSLALRANVSVLAGGGVGLGMALAGLGVWSLVGQKLAEAIVALALLWWCSPWRPGLRFSRRHLREIFGFSAAVFVSRVVGEIGRRIDVLLAGLFFGPVGAGLYRLAGSAVSSIFEMTTRPLTMVALPEYARLQEAPAALRSSLLEGVRLSALLALPAFALIAALSDRLVQLLGPEWADAAGALRFLSMGAAVQALTLFAPPLLLARGRAWTWAAITVGVIALDVGALVAAGWVTRSQPLAVQVTWLAIAFSAVLAVAWLPISVLIMRSLGGVRLAELGGAVAPALTASLAAALVAFVASEADVLHAMGGAGQLALIAAVASIAGITVLLSLDPELRRLGVRVARWRAPAERVR